MASFGSFTGVSPSSTGQGPPHNPNKDIEITSPPSDSISSLTWSPAANLLVASSWDNQVRCWEVAQNGQSAPKAVTAHDQPVLCTAWSPDGTTVFSGRGPCPVPPRSDSPWWSYNTIWPSCHSMDEPWVACASVKLGEMPP
jgi:WD40 repeat protein